MAKLRALQRVVEKRPWCAIDPGVEFVGNTVVSREPVPAIPALLRPAQRTGGEWRPLFYRILENRIRDLQRRRTVRNKIMVWLPGPKQDPEHDSVDPMDQVADGGPGGPERMMQDQAMRRLEGSLRGLPARQREAFVLRNFEGLDVAQTALAMGCSQGSVKTHYSRAVHRLREQLGEVW